MNARAFGGGGPDNSNHTYLKEDVDSKHTTYKVPSQADIDYQLPKDGSMTMKFHRWLNGKWDPCDDERL